LVKFNPAGKDISRPVFCLKPPTHASIDNPGMIPGRVPGGDLPFSAWVALIKGGRCGVRVTARGNGTTAVPAPAWATEAPGSGARPL
jgi:hypothetical protein